MNKSSKEKLSLTPWYSEGLEFTCTGCGACCTGGPGAVWISESECTKLANRLLLSVEQFKKTYTRLIDGRRSLLEKENYDCIFLKDKACSVYEERPAQCKTFPFWPNLLHSRNNWEDAAQSCEGINRTGRCWSQNEIEQQRKEYEEKVSEDE